MIDMLKNNKMKVSMVGGVLIIVTAYGTCSFDPDETAIKEAVEEKVEEIKSEAPSTAAPEVKVEEPTPVPEVSVDIPAEESEKKQVE